MVGASLKELVLLLRGLCNLISSSAHSSVVRGHVELFRQLVLLPVVDKKLMRLKSLLGVSKERLDYWQVRCRTS